MHEYSVSDQPKDKILFFMALASISLAPLISKLINILSAKYFSDVLSLTLSTSTLFGIIYLLFNYFLWKVPFIRSYCRVPDLNGEWVVEGLSHNTEKKTDYPWDGTIVIKQTWDKMLISLRTSKSSSQSLSIISGIKKCEGLGFKLSYHYENTPNPDEKELKKHEGFCSLTIYEDGISADGCYFNNIKDRQTYGSMKLKKKVK